MAEVRYRAGKQPRKVAAEPKRSKPSGPRVHEFNPRGRAKDVADPAIATLLAPQQQVKGMPPAAKQPRESPAAVTQRLGIPRQTVQRWLDGDRHCIASWVDRELEAWADRRSN